MREKLKSLLAYILTMIFTIAICVGVINYLIQKPQPPRLIIIYDKDTVKDTIYDSFKKQKR